jgi:DNA-binding CsgD family transcriptional regulator
VLRGRAEQLTGILTVLRRATRTGQGAIVLVSGEAGIGKTALLRACATEAGRLGFAVGVGKAEEVDQIAPGAPLLVALRSGAQPLLDSAAFGALADLYGQPLWLVDRIAALIEELATRSPVLIAIDDAQWADRLTRFALRLLPGRLAGSPVVWLLTTRDPRGERVDDLTASAESTDGVLLTRIGLTGLADADLETLAQDRLGGPATGRLRQRLHGVGGNPFLAGQLLDGVADARSEDEVPQPLVAGIRRQVRSLSPGAADLVRLTSVWGRPLPIEDAEKLLETPLDEIVAQSREAAERGLLLLEDERILFRHDLVRESVYVDLPAARRRALHLRFAEHLLSTGAGPLAAAGHARAGATVGDERAVTILAAAAAESTATMPEAAAELILEAFALLPEDHPGRLEIGEQCADLLSRAQRGFEAVALLDGLLARPHEPEAEAQLQVSAARALWLTGSVGDIGYRMDAALARPGISAPLRARLAATRALALTRTGEPRAAALAAEAALTEGLKIGDEPAQALALQALGQAAKNEGRHQLSLDHFRRFRTLAGPIQVWEEIRALQLLDRFDEAQQMLAAASRDAENNHETLLPSLMHAQLWQDFNLGRIDEAEAGARTIIRLSDELGHYVHRLGAWTVLSAIALTRGDTALARERLRPVEQDDRDDDDIRLLGLQLMQAWVSAAEGSLDESLSILRPLVSSARDSRRYWPWWPTWSRLFAGVGVAAGDAEFTRQAVELAEIGAERNPKVTSFEGVALHTRGFVTRDADLLADAVAVLERGPRPMLLAGALTDYGTVLLAGGERDRGVAELDRAWELYQRHDGISGMTTIAGRLRQAGVRRRNRATPERRPETGWSSLTEAEHTVAQLVGQGHTNRSAAEQLGVSVNTVGTHLRAVFTKLEVRSRVQLTNALHELQAEGPPSA